MAFKSEKSQAAAQQSVLHVWQIDSFEGGKGSRADFLQKVGTDFSKNNECYVSVVALSADAARLNLADGNVPDVISYGAGIFGIESYIRDYTTWCHGGYCFLTLDTNSDFSDINSDNTVINAGKENFTSAVALFCGVQGAKYEKSTGAYVKLINSEYKYLLGTQRDIYRLKTRGVNFVVKPITQFNDLYQNISVMANTHNPDIAQRFIEYLLTRTEEVNKLGLMCDKTGLYDDEMKQMEGLEYEYKLISPVSENSKKQLENFIAQGDINMLKNLLK